MSINLENKFKYLISNMVSKINIYRYNVVKKRVKINVFLE